MILVVTFCLLGLTLSEGMSQDQKPAWTKQLGTIHHPKIPTPGCDIVKGSVYLIQNRYFRSKMNGKYDAIMLEEGLPSSGDHGNKAWREILKGSFIFPKSLIEDTDVLMGDIFKSTDGKYFRAEQNGKLSVNIDGDFDIKTQWEEIDYKAGWMGLLRDEIGDERLGEIFTPGTHDSGTEGINSNSYLVDQDALFQFAQDFDPQIMSNWSRTQTATLGEQCRAGFRSFDLRIADMEEQDGSFRWWHGTTGHEIQLELQEVVDFLEEYPNEVLRMDFTNFARPGNSDNPIVSIPNYRKDMISEIILEYLEPYLALQSELRNNPTMNEVLSTGKNVILEMRDDYIRSKHDGFWPQVSVYEWSGRTNPEDLFIHRSESLMRYREQFANRMTRVSGCNTPDEKMIIGGLLRVYGEDESVRDIIAIIWPELLDIDPDLMSFEGMWTDLLTFTNQGTNTGGMRVRGAGQYTSGASVHYGGVNDMVNYWLARPQKYKLNEIHVDDILSSTLVDTAILHAKGEIPREVTIAFQGNARDGYYRWDDSGYQTIGGSDGLRCKTPSLARYRVKSASYNIDTAWQDLPHKGTVSFQEGQYPSDAAFELEVSGSGHNEWIKIHEDTILNMIENNLDLYLWGTNREAGTGGFAYTSYTYNAFGDACDEPPQNGYLELKQW